MPGNRGIVQLLDVLVGAYSIAVFAAVAGSLGAYFLERRNEHGAVLDSARSTASTDGG